MTKAPNQVASGNGAITLWFHFEHLRRAVPEQIRWALNVPGDLAVNKL